MKVMVSVSLVLLLGVMVGVSSAELVGQWTFDSQDGSDSSGYMHNAVVVGVDPNYVSDSERGTVAQFGGTGYFKVNSADISTAENQFTFTCWIKGGNEDNANYAAVARRLGGAGFYLEKYSPTQFYLGVAGNLYFPSFLDSQWHFLVCQYDGSKQIVYLDGIKYETIKSAGPVTGDLFFGGREDPAYSFSGCMDDVRLYDHMLDESELEAISGVAISNVLFSLDFEDGIIDAGPLGNDPVVNGSTPTLVDDSERGGKVAYFDRTGYLSVPQPVDGFTFTYTCWVKGNADDNGSYSTIAYQLGSAGSWWFQVENAQKAYFGLNGNTSFPNPLDGQWHFIAIVSDGVSRTVYFDNKKYSGMTGGASINGDVCIGGQGNSVYGFTGYLDDVVMYGVALSDYDVEDILGMPVEHRVVDLKFEGDLSDSSVYGHSVNAIDIATPTYFDDPERGMVLELDGSGYLNIPYVYSAVTSDDFTFTCWVKGSPVDNYRPYNGIAGIYGGNTWTLQLDGDPSSMYFNISNNDGESGILHAPSVFDGEWHFVAVSYGNNEEHLYIDNEEYSHGSVGAVAPAGDFKIGGFAPGYNIVGYLDDVRLYNVALDKEDMFPTADINGDLKVDLEDLTIMSSQWLMSGGDMF